MREIKFSYIAQHEDAGRLMDQVFTIEQIEGGNFVSQWKQKFPRWHIIARREYTGLKDKNGKEVYEGDIINDFGNGHEDENGTWVRDSRYGVVQFFEGFFGVKVKELDYTYIPTPIGSSKEWEIVGNLYENPELLEVNNGGN